MPIGIVIIITNFVVISFHLSYQIESIEKLGVELQIFPLSR